MLDDVLLVEDLETGEILYDNPENIYLSARNVPGARVMRASDVNTYALLDNKALILTESGLAVINNL